MTKGKKTPKAPKNTATKPLELDTEKSKEDDGQQTSVAITENTPLTVESIVPVKSVAELARSNDVKQPEKVVYNKWKEKKLVQDSSEPKDGPNNIASTNVVVPVAAQEKSAVQTNDQIKSNATKVLGKQNTNKENNVIKSNNTKTEAKEKTELKVVDVNVENKHQENFNKGPVCPPRPKENFEIKENRKQKNGLNGDNKTGKKHKEGPKDIRKEPKAEFKKDESKAEPKKEESKAEPKKEEPKAEPKKEEPKAEPKKEESKHEPKKEEPKVKPKKEEPKVEPKKEESKAEPKKEEPKAEPKKEESKAEPKKEESKAEPKKEEPKKEEPKIEPKKEEPKAEPKKEDPEARHEPKKEEQTKKEPTSEPKKEQPKIELKKELEKKQNSAPNDATKSVVDSGNQSGVIKICGIEFSQHVHGKAISTIFDEKQSSDEKFINVCDKYKKLYADFSVLQLLAQRQEKELAVQKNEAEILECELAKQNLSREKLEHLCRGLQQQNKEIREENLKIIREEEDKRKSVAQKFQTTLNEISNQVKESNTKTNKLRDDNMDITVKFRDLLIQYEEKEQELYDYKNRCAEMLQTEKSLRNQISMYTEKYDEFQQTLSRSNEIFAGFKSEMESMSVKINNLESETATWKARWENSHQSYLEVHGQKTKAETELLTTSRQLATLLKLTRTLQAERATLLTQLHGNEAGIKATKENEANQDALEETLRHLAKNVMETFKKTDKSVESSSTEPTSSNSNDAVSDSATNMPPNSPRSPPPIPETPATKGNNKKGKKNKA